MLTLRVAIADDVAPSSKCIFISEGRPILKMFEGRINAEGGVILQDSETRPSTAPSVGLSGWVTGWRGAAVLFGLVLLTYAPAIAAEYIWDDDQYVTENVQLRSFEGLRRIWFEPKATPQYYPLVFSTFWVEYQLWGLNPIGYHVVNILLHGLNAVLLLKLLEKLKVPGAFFAAALFVVAPVHVESVAWVTERKNVLSGVFYLSAFLAYWRFAKWTEDEHAPRPTLRWVNYVLSMLLFGCALMSKSVTCSLPAAILLVVWWEKGKLAWRDVVPLLPMFAIGVAAGLNTVLMEKNHVGAQGLDWEWTLVERFLIAGRALWFYAMKIVWPEPLVFIYPKWKIDASVWWQYAFVLSFLALVVYLWVARRRIGRGPLVGVLFFAGTLFPALGFIDVYPMRFSFVADHFQYLASIGLIVLLGALGAAISSKLRLPENLAFLCAAVVVVAFGRISFIRCIDYMDAESLWVATLEDNPNCWMANHNLAAIRFDQQRFADAYDLMQNAMRRKVDDEPSHEELADFNFYLGATLVALGRAEEATPHYRAARDFFEQLAETESPPSALTHNNLGILNGILQNQEAALQSFQRALEIDPNDLEVNLNLGEMYFQLKRFDESAGCFRNSIKIDPKSVRAHYNLGAVDLMQGQRQQAIRHLRDALRIDPSFTAARMALQQAMTTNGLPPQLNQPKASGATDSN